jgi:hypothetical protein
MRIFTRHLARINLYAGALALAALGAAGCTGERAAVGGSPGSAPLQAGAMSAVAAAGSETLRPASSAPGRSCSPEEAAHFGKTPDGSVVDLDKPLPAGVILPAFVEAFVQKIGDSSVAVLARETWPANGDDGGPTSDIVCAPARSALADGYDFAFEVPIGFPSAHAWATYFLRQFEVFNGPREFGFRGYNPSGMSNVSLKDFVAKAGGQLYLVGPERELVLRQQQAKAPWQATILVHYDVAEQAP